MAKSSELLECEVQLVGWKHTLCGEIEDADDAFIVCTPHSTIESTQAFCQPWLEPGLHDARRGFVQKSMDLSYWFCWVIPKYEGLSRISNEDAKELLGTNCCIKMVVDQNLQATLRRKLLVLHSDAPCRAVLCHQVVDKLPCHVVHFLAGFPPRKPYT